MIEGHAAAGAWPRSFTRNGDGSYSDTTTLATQNAIRERLRPTIGGTAR
jgi:hypothetical protein